MSTTLALTTSNSSINSIPVCLAETEKWLYVFLMPVPLISGLVNVIVFLAATIYRSKLLRHNYVYLCVTSTLFSHLLFLALHLWDEISSYRMNPLVSASPPQGKMKILWTLCQSGAVAMLFGMCCNLGALIFVMIDSAHFQIASSLSPTSTNDTKTGFLRAKKIKAIVLVSLSWMLPLVLTLLAVFTLNCVDRCRCSPGSKGDVCPRNFGCSAVWAPLTISFMSINIVLWFCEVAGLVILLLVGIKNFQKFSGGAKSSSPKSPKTVVSTEEQPPAEINQADDGDVPNNSEPEADIQTIPMNYRRASRWSWYHRNPRLRCAFLLSTVFVICTLPIVVAYFIDLSNIPFPVAYTRTSAMMIVHLYTLICPILLVTYLSNLRTAVRQLISAALFCV